MMQMQKMKIQKKKENNNENNGESNLKFEIDPQCYQLLNDIANFRLG